MMMEREIIGPGYQHHILFGQRGGSWGAEDTLEEENDGEDGEEGGEGEDNIHAKQEHTINMTTWSLKALTYMNEEEKER